MKLTKTSGATIAAAAAAFILSGTVMTPVSSQAAEKNIHCFGKNVCKGTSACKTGSNACKGKNACKGNGFVAISAEACKAIGGSTEEKK